MAERWTSRDLLSAGWREADLSWEHITEQALDAAAGNDAARAKDEAGSALQMARADFEAIDPRLGTSLANYGVCLELAGQGDGSARLFGEALDVWRGCGPWIARMTAPRVARSSMFHMRMELRHRDTYRERWQVKWREIADEAQARLKALAAQGTADVSPSEVMARWQRERPAMLNDTRKLLGAAFLLLAPAPASKS